MNISPVYRWTVFLSRALLNKQNTPKKNNNLNIRMKCVLDTMGFSIQRANIVQYQKLFNSFFFSLLSVLNIVWNPFFSAHLLSTYLYAIIPFFSSSLYILAHIFLLLSRHWNFIVVLLFLLVQLILIFFFTNRATQLFARLYLIHIKEVQCKRITTKKKSHWIFEVRWIEKKNKFNKNYYMVIELSL